MCRFHDAVAGSFAAFHADASARARDAIRGPAQRHHVTSIILADQDGHLRAGLASRDHRLRGVEKLLKVLGKQAHWIPYRYSAGGIRANLRWITETDRKESAVVTAQQALGP
jgi:hypothetical protein